MFTDQEIKECYEQEKRVRGSPPSTEKLNQVSGSLDPETKAEFDGWIPEGFQVNKARRPRKDIPEWASSIKRIEIKILRPAAIAARRRCQIAYLYWNLGWTAREVGQAVKMKVERVKYVIRQLVSSEIE